MINRFGGRRVGGLAAGMAAVFTLGAARMESRALPPATQPVAAAQLKAAQAKVAPAAGVTLPGSFATLAKKSIFARNGIAATPPGTNPRPPEAMMALRGIAFDDSSFLAFVEDTGSHRTMQLKSGDALAGGKISQITLDDMAFEASGKVTQVRVGQNLLGMMLPPMPAAPKPAGPVPGAPAEGPPTVKPPGGPIYEIGPNGQRVRNLVKERAG